MEPFPGQLGQSTVIVGDHRTPRRHRLRDCASERLREAREVHDDVDLLDRRPRITGFAGDLQVLRQSVEPRQLSEILDMLVCRADQDEAKNLQLMLGQRSQSNEVGQALLRRTTADQSHTNLRLHHRILDVEIMNVDSVMDLEASPQEAEGSQCCVRVADEIVGPLSHFVDDVLALQSNGCSEMRIFGNDLSCMDDCRYT